MIEDYDLIKYIIIIAKFTQEVSEKLIGLIQEETTSPFNRIIGGQIKIICDLELTSKLILLIESGITPFKHKSLIT